MSSPAEFGVSISGRRNTPEARDVKFKTAGVAAVEFSYSPTSIVGFVLKIDVPAAVGVE